MIKAYITGSKLPGFHKKIKPATERKRKPKLLLLSVMIIPLENHKKPEPVQLPYANKTNTTKQIKYSAQNMGTFKKWATPESITPYTRYSFTISSTKSN